MMIIVEHLTKEYIRGVRALDNINLRIETGIFGLLGPNGAGKTTLMRILATLLAPTSGSVNVYGYDIKTKPQEIRRIIGYLPQEYSLYPDLSAWEFLDYMGILSGLECKQRKERITQILNQVDLYNNRYHRIKTFSGGMKQRLAIAQALLSNPRVLIIDEPTSGLDPTERVRFRQFLTEFGRDRLILLSTHIVEDIRTSCSLLAILEKGHLLYQGTASELISRAKGYVGQDTIPAGYMAEFSKKYTITSAVSQEGEVVCRFLSLEGVPQNLCVLPTLEEAYLLLVQLEKHHAISDTLRNSNY